MSPYLHGPCRSVMDPHFFSENMNDVKRTQDPEDLGKSMEFMDLKLDCLMVELSKYGKVEVGVGNDWRML